MDNSYVDPTVVAAIIGAIGTVLAAVLGAVLGRSGVLDRVISRGRGTSLVGKWDSWWMTSGVVRHESLVVEHQRGARVSGFITHENEPDKKWNFDGNFSGKYLQLSYYPARDSQNRLFQDYGCYFLELSPQGDFVGMSVGVDMDTGRIGVDPHNMKLVR